MADLDLYERDFIRWSEEQASLLRSIGLSGTNLPLDWEHLAEEIDSLGRSLRSELRHRLATVIEHLLKLEVSLADQPRAGWIETIERERLEIEELVDENPSLRPTLPESVAAAHGRAKKLAKLSLDKFGEWTPEAREAVQEARFTVEQVTRPWFPGERASG